MGAADGTAPSWFIAVAGRRSGKRAAQEISTVGVHLRVAPNVVIVAPRAAPDLGGRGTLPFSANTARRASIDEFRCHRCKATVRVNLAKLYRAADDAAVNGRDLYL